ncbi:hypothetical protein B566_EDAN018216, partial [Ephemera danica]
MYLMGKCRESLEDASRAWSHGYCDNTVHELCAVEMKCHRDLGNMREAHECLKKASNALHRLSGLSNEEIADEDQKLESELMAPSMKTCNEIIIFPDKVPDLSYGPSTDILGVSSAVRMEYSEHYGRHLVANRDIRLGDVLLIGENAAGTVSETFMHNHCSHCHKLCFNLLPCQNCVLVMFCSEQCRFKANQKYHLSECTA